ncbi:hypothetical protein AB0E69_36075 [Kribbella sp. NPDC026611]|uniref:hypothetical protein n=1 Tax=Kribbella sp. NPDC026611 TaxID=3154911 RepID=UPI0033EADD6F
MTAKYEVVVHPELRKEINALAAAAKAEDEKTRAERKAWAAMAGQQLPDDWKPPRGPAGQQLDAFVEAMRALREGRERDPKYRGSKQLGYGPQSHDLRDTAELKVPVFDRGGTPEFPAQSHRLVYREFRPPTVLREDGTAAREGLPIRQLVAFNDRGDEPAAVAGERLGRVRGMAESDLRGVVGGGRPEIGRVRDDAQITPHAMEAPPDVLAEVRRLQGVLAASPPAGTNPPAPAPEARVNRPGEQGPEQAQEK